MGKFTQSHDSNFRPPKDREFLTRIPTNFDVVHLGTTMLHFLQMIHCLRQHQPNAKLFNCACSYSVT